MFYVFFILSSFEVEFNYPELDMKKAETYFNTQVKLLDNKNDLN